MNIAPRLPDDWRTLLADARREGYPDTPKHRLAYRNFVQRCFPTYVDSTDPDVREQIDAWWVLYQLPRDGVWQYWLTAPSGSEVRLSQAAKDKAYDEDVWPKLYGHI